jgi:hypothetical protein
VYLLCSLFTDCSGELSSKRAKRYLSSNLRWRTEGGYVIPEYDIYEVNRDEQNFR